MTLLNDFCRGVWIRSLREIHSHGYYTHTGSKPSLIATACMVSRLSLISLTQMQDAEDNKKDDQK